jgi:hypothetical protein
MPNAKGAHVAPFFCLFGGLKVAASSVDDIQKMQG